MICSYLIVTLGVLHVAVRTDLGGGGGGRGMYSIHARLYRIATI